MTSKKRTPTKPPKDKPLTLEVLIGKMLTDHGGAIGLHSRERVPNPNGASA